MSACIACGENLSGPEEYGDWDQPFCFDCWQDICRDYNQPSYGKYLGGDPRNFTPDPECSTAEERARHKDDCAAWDRGEFIDRGAGWCGYGLGVNEKGCNLV